MPEQKKITVSDILALLEYDKEVEIELFTADPAIAPIYAYLDHSLETAGECLQSLNDEWLDARVLFMNTWRDGRLVISATTTNDRILDHIFIRKRGKYERSTC